MPIHRSKFLQTAAMFASAVTVLLYLACNKPAEAPSTEPPQTQVAKHGLSLLVEWEPAKAGTNALAALKPLLLRRLDRFGSTGFIEPSGTNQMRLTVTGVESNEFKLVTDLLAFGGAFEMRLVHEDSDALVAAGITVPGYEILTEHRETTGDKPITIFRLVKITPELSGPRIQQVTLDREPVARIPIILVQLDKEGAAALSEITARSIGRLLAIVVDRRIVTAPRIMEPILGGTAAIRGDITLAEALIIAIALENPLPFPVAASIETTF